MVIQGPLPMKKQNFNYLTRSAQKSQLKFLKCFFSCQNKNQILVLLRHFFSSVESWLFTVQTANDMVSQQWQLLLYTRHILRQRIALYYCCYWISIIIHVCLPNIHMTITKNATVDSALPYRPPYLWSWYTNRQQACEQASAHTQSHTYTYTQKQTCGLLSYCTTIFTNIIICMPHFWPITFWLNA